MARDVVSLDKVVADISKDCGTFVFDGSSWIC